MPMSPDKPRFLYNNLPGETEKGIVLITGARQTGKTTLTKKRYSQLPYMNLDAVEERLRLEKIPTSRWAKDVGLAAIDEVQKEPSVFEKIKYAYDAGALSFSVLLGSSQILLLKKIRESLAGRITIFELFPMMMAELSASDQSTLKAPLLDKLLGDEAISHVLEREVSILPSPEEAEKLNILSYMMNYGGMPALLHLPEENRMRWLKDYELTYLERDLADLARLSDLEPFRLFQKLSALRSASLLNYSELARDASISVDTAKRYLEYLKLSYQVELLQPYYRNLTSSLVKTPKLYWLDIGIWRVLSGFSGQTSGQLIETMVVSEIIKWIKTMRRAVELYFYRTRSGLEVDLLMQTSHGLIGVEIKSRQECAGKDATPLQQIAAQLGEEWRGGLIVYGGNSIKRIAEPNIWAVPFWRLLM
ncbi:MAG TPA: ATP-binding protein [Gammaproteobacteria bacterium]|jgi:predicted AAA+ superfamily ATPase|nr:ATP-binding protein [Gammaproteobacteria bacterium]